VQPGFGFQPQMVPGMRPGGPMPNFFVPFVQPGQQEPRPGGRRGGSASMHQNQQAMPVMHNQVLFILFHYS
jgi:polyadenylate-binding protein